MSDKDFYGPKLIETHAGHHWDTLLTAKQTIETAQEIATLRAEVERLKVFPDGVPSFTTIEPNLSCPTVGFTFYLDETPEGKRNWDERERDANAIKALIEATPALYNEVRTLDTKLQTAEANATVLLDAGIKKHNELLECEAKLATAEAEVLRLRDFITIEAEALDDAGFSVDGDRFRTALSNGTGQ